MLNGQADSPEAVKKRVLCRGVRGATVADADTAEAILAATRELLFTMIQHNEINPYDVASVYFTTTEDLVAAYPATAARQLGWYDVPLLCGHEMRVPGGLPHCIRILLHWNTGRAPEEITHVYLHDATRLRPDKSDIPPVPAAEIERFMRNSDEPAGSQFSPSNI